MSCSMILWRLYWNAYLASFQMLLVFLSFLPAHVVQYFGQEFGINPEFVEGCFYVKKSQQCVC